MKNKKENWFTKIYGPVTKGWIINRSICCAVMIGLIVAINIGNSVINTYANQITAYLCPPITDNSAVSKAQAKAAELAKTVELEGAALLKNNDNVLPLSKTDDKKVNVFGYGSVDWSYGGIGNGSSGQVRPEDDNINSVVDLMKALKRYGISTNSEIQSFYKKWCEPVNLIKDPNSIDRATARALREPSMDKYSTQLLDNAKAYSSTAIAVISRTCHENNDLPNIQTKAGPGQVTDETRHYLEISTEEEEMLTYLGKNYEKVIVVINAGNIMELDFMDRIPGLDACVYVGVTGTQAASSIPSLLYGDKSFSGKLVDTIPYTFNDHPASYSTWFGANNYAGSDIGGIDYVEGIYVGYKWFETADHEGVYDNVDRSATYGEHAKGYEGVVQYPFGYGLSYTSFDWEIVKSEPATGTSINENTKFSIDVKVTNTGLHSGKDVIEAYVTLPYTKGGIEKSYVNLVGFAKTEELMPNGSQVVTIEIDAEDFLSYDCYDKNNNDFKGYELEAGDYEIKLMTDSHNIKQIAGSDAILTYKVDETIKCPTDKHTGVEVKNLFTGDDAIDGISIDGIDSEHNANIPFMSRNDFNLDYKIPERTKEVYNRPLSDKEKSVSVYSAQKASDWDNATTDVFGNEVNTVMPTWGASTSYKLAESSGVITELGLELGSDYNNPKWDEVLNQVKYSEAINMINNAQSGNKGIASIGKPRLFCYDSMVQIKGFAGKPRGTGNPSTVILAQTWNEHLAYQYATNFANEMNSLTVQAVFGPGVNLHRSPFGGRNWEYFSEDTFMTSLMACTIVRGLQNYGCGVEMKHFALNECESWRYACSTWLSEQALRETYLRPFQRATQQENLSGIMTAFNRIGSQWAGGSQGLIMGVLRNEWGFNGYIDTDWTTGIKGTIDEQLRAGGDLGMACALGQSISYDYSQGATTARFQNQVRGAVKHVLYGWLSTKYQASVYEPSADEEITMSFSIDRWQWWKPAVTCLNCAIYFGVAIWLVCLFVPSYKKDEKTKKESK